jgi:hypothetical protein
MATMSNAEFNSMTSAETPFIEAINRVYLKFFAGKKQEELKKFYQTDFARYVSRTQRYVDEIRINVEDMAMIKDLLMEHDPCGARLERTNKESIRLIRYHYENFFIRIGKTKDLFLILINHVMQLGIKKSLTMEKQVIDKISPSYPEFEKIWALVKDQIDPIKPYRNHLAHNGSFTHEDMTLLNAYYRYEMPHKNLLEKYRHEFAMGDIQSEVVQAMTDKIGIYLVNLETLQKAIFIFLTHPFMDQLKIMIKKPSR